MFVLPSQLESIARRIIFCHCEARRAEAISSAHAISVDYVTWGCKPKEVWLLLGGPERPPRMLALNRNPVPLALLGYGAGSVSGSGIRREPLWAAPAPAGRCSAPARSARPRQTSRLALNPRGASGSGSRAAWRPSLLAE